MSAVPSIVVAYAPVGSGHRLAAEAIARELREAAGEAAEIELVDVSDEAASWPVSFSSGALTASPLGRAVLRALDPVVAASARRFADRLLAVQPVAVVSTHPFATTVAAHLAANGRIRATVLSAATDFDLPGPAPQRGVGLYCTATQTCADALQRRGVRDNSIVVTGIPVRPQFTVEYDTDAARNHFGLPHDRRFVLAIAGSSDPERYERLKDALVVALPALASLPDTAVAIVTGHDAAFSTLIDARSKGFGTTNVRVMNYVEHMAALIACADLVIAKPAGMVCAECVDTGVPLVLVGAADRHERTNARALVTSGAAAYAEDPSTLSDHVRKVIGAPKRMQKMREAAGTMARPFAAADIARYALSHAGIGDRPDGLA